MTMDPNEALRLAIVRMVAAEFDPARRAELQEEAIQHFEDVLTWVAAGGFAPDWEAADAYKWERRKAHMGMDA